MRLLCCLLLSLSLALGQLCLDELHGVLAGQELSEPARGLEAAQLVARAVELLEPNLPPLRYLSPAPEAALTSAHFLAERELLPDDWQPHSLTLEVWQEMLARLAGWYRLSPPAATSLARAALIADLAALIGEISPRLRPVALIATAQRNRQAVAFWGVIRNDAIYPRLIVYRPPEGQPLAEGPIRSLLPQLSTCAQPLRHYVHAPEDTARRLFANHADGQMVIVSTAPPITEGLIVVPSGAESDYLTFNALALAPYSSYAAVFAGASANPLLVTRLLPQVRTNLNPRELLGLLFPGR